MAGGVGTTGAGPGRLPGGAGGYPSASAAVAGGCGATGGRRPVPAGWRVGCPGRGPLPGERRSRRPLPGRTGPRHPGGRLDPVGALQSGDPATASLAADSTPARRVRRGPGGGRGGSVLPPSTPPPGRRGGLSSLGPDPGGCGPGAGAGISPATDLGNPLRRGGLPAYRRPSVKARQWSQVPAPGHSAQPPAGASPLPAGADRGALARWRPWRQRRGSDDLPASAGQTSPLLATFDPRGARSSPGSGSTSLRVPRRVPGKIPAWQGLGARFWLFAYPSDTPSAAGPTPRPLAPAPPPRP